MPAERFVDALNDQIGREFGASQQYLAVAVHYEALSLPRLAALFYEQSLEERGHALMMVKYLLDSGAEVRIPGVAAPRTDFADVATPVAVALEQERNVSDQISALTAIARNEGDYLSEQFMLWFLKEQVEEVSAMSELLATIEHAGDDVLQVEQYLTREDPRAGEGDPTAPPVAGAPAA